MKILLTHRYFWPDSPPYAEMLKVIATHLASEKTEQGDANHEVGVFTSMPSYAKAEASQASKRETMDGVEIVRCRTFKENKKNILTRILNVFIYCIGLYFHIRKQKPDVVSGATFPPIFAAWTASLAAKQIGAKFVYHMQDIHPEVSAVSGGLLSRPIFQKTLRWFDSQTIGRTDTVVVLSKDMEETLLSRSDARPRAIKIINNFLQSGDDFNQINRSKSGKYTVLFAGNIGRFQGLSTIVEAAMHLKDNEDIQFSFMGDGVALAELKQRASALPNVNFLPFMPFAEAQSVIAQADLGIVSLQKDMYKIAYPSKTLTYLALGVPILAVIEPQSELGHMVEDDVVGATVEDVSASSVADAVLRAYDLTQSGTDLRGNASALYQDRFATTIAMQSWSNVIGDLPKAP